MKKALRISITFLFLLVVTGLVPHHASAAGLVTCGTDGPINPNGTQACGFTQLIQLVSNIIDFLIFIVAPIIMVCVLLYAGTLLIFSSGSPESVSKAKSAFFKAVTGMVIAMTAWILVKFVLDKLGIDTSVFPVFY